jgi:ribosomal protein S18 acetylase RimI-like enzyme
VTRAVVRATPTDGDRVAALIGEAFCSLAVARWLVHDDDERARVLTAHSRILVDHALPHGLVDLIADHSAVAVWFPQDQQPQPAPTDYDARMAAACGPWAEQFRALDAAFAAHHPHDPHHHLGFLAVRPDHHGRGLGSTLLRHHHRQLDETTTAAYLEASSPRSRALYQRHGYRDLGPAFTLPDNGPPLWPMWREPRSDGDAHPVPEHPDQLITHQVRTREEAAATARVHDEQCARTERRDGIA